MNTIDDLYHQGSEYAALKQNSIASDRIQIVEKMASGQFGTVYKGLSILFIDKSKVIYFFNYWFELNENKVPYLLIVNDY